MYINKALDDKFSAFLSVIILHDIKAVLYCKRMGKENTVVVDPKSDTKKDEGQDGNKQPNTADQSKSNKEEKAKTETKPSETKQEPAKKDEPKSYADGLNKVRAMYEERLRKERESHAQDVKERDDIIAQLCAGNESDEPTKPLGYKSIKERIAERRNFKKW